MNHSLKSLFFLFFITLTSLYSQNNSIKLFLKCSCDSNYIRDQINYIDYVRDQEDANIILEVYGDPNGNRGKYSIYFIGKKKFIGIDDQLSFESHPKMTNDEIIDISSNWTEILSSQKLEADKIHTYLDLNQCGPVNYVKLNIYPDGGVSRLRIFGDLSS